MGMLAPDLFALVHKYCAFGMLAYIPLILWNGCNMVFIIEMSFSIF